MPRNSFTPVSVRRRSAAHGCTTVHPDARSAGGTIRGLTEDYRANYRVINNLSHTLSTPGNNPVRWGKVQHRGSQVQGSTGPITGSICYDQGLDETAPSLKNRSKIKENGLSGQIFLACGALKRASPRIGYPDRPPHTRRPRPPVETRGTPQT